MVAALGITWTACAFALAFTLLLVIIDIVSRSRREGGSLPGVMTCAVWQLLPYFLVLAGGNVIATWFVPILVPNDVQNGWFDPLPSWVRPFAYAFLGVFAFRGILSNLSYSALGADLSVGDWVGRARDSAVAAVLAKQVKRDNDDHQRRARRLREFPESDLNANIAQLLGQDAVRQLEHEAKQSNTDAKLYKALHLAKEKPDEVDAILTHSSRAG